MDGSLDRHTHPWYSQTMRRKWAMRGAGCSSLLMAIALGACSGATEPAQPQLEPTEPAQPQQQPAQPQQAQPTKRLAPTMGGDEPVLLLTRTVHHPPKIGAWSHFRDPELVLYGDGKVIFKGPEGLHTVQLSAEEVDAFWGDYDVGAFLALEDSYSVDRRLDPPLHFITYWHDSKAKRVRVIGTLPGDPKTPAPAAFMALAERMRGYRHDRARAYEPERLAITALEATDGNQLHPWPEGWPDLKHPDTSKNRAVSSESYTIILSAEHRAGFEALLKKIDDGGRIEMNGPRWYMHPQRYLLPHEARWSQDGR